MVVPWCSPSSQVSLETSSNGQGDGFKGELRYPWSLLNYIQEDLQDQNYLHNNGEVSLAFFYSYS